MHAYMLPQCPICGKLKLPPGLIVISRRLDSLDVWFCSSQCSAARSELLNPQEVLCEAEAILKEAREQ